MNQLPPLAPRINPAKSHPTNLRTLLAAAALGSVSLAGLSQGAVTATIIETDIAPFLDPNPGSSQAYTPALTASSIDLIQGLLPSHESHPGIHPNYEFARGAGAWTDGSLATTYRVGIPAPSPENEAEDTVAHHAYGSVGIGSLVQYDLGGIFDLTYIDVFMGWNDGGRDQSSFRVWVSGDGVDFTEIADYQKSGNNDPSGRPVTHQVRIIDDGGAFIAEGVRYVEFRVYDADNSHAGIAEIDIFGVPEPGTAVLGLLGGLFLLRRKRF